MIDKDDACGRISSMRSQGIWTGYMASEKAVILKNDKINAREIRTPTSTSPKIATIF